ncbi:MAG: Crp/Fnr family transcriptional regulator [Candidatus Binatia bacterium]
MKIKRVRTVTIRREGKIVVVSFCRGVELFQGISEADCHTISRLCSERRFAQGATLFSEGDPSDALYILKEGHVNLISVSEKGTETLLHILKPDEIVGALLLVEERRSFTAVAIEDVLITVIPRENFLVLLSSVPAVAVNFARLLSQRLEKVEREQAEFSHTRSYHRLARTLLELSERHGEEVSTGTLITLRLTHQDLANYIGTTRETVTTQINRLKRMGLLNRQDRHFIVDRSRLDEFLNSEEMRLSQP